MSDLEPHRFVGADVGGGGSSPDRTNTVAPSGSGKGSLPKLTMQRKPGSRLNDNTSAGTSSSHTIVPSPSAGLRRRSASVAR